VIAAIVTGGFSVLTQNMIDGAQRQADDTKANRDERLAAYTAFDTATTTVRGTLSRLAYKIQTDPNRVEVTQAVAAALADLKAFNTASFSVELVSTGSTTQDELALNKLVNDLAVAEGVQQSPIDKAVVVIDDKTFSDQAICLEDRFLVDARLDLGIDATPDPTLRNQCG